MAHKYLVTLTAGEDGYIVAECPSLPGCVFAVGSKAT